MNRLAIFDCDGTLVDSQHNICAAMAEAFTRSQAIPPSRAAILRVVGLSLIEAMRVLVPDADADFHERLAAGYKTAFQQLRARGMVDEPLYDGIADLLDTLEADGWLLGVATGKSDRGLGLVLDHHALTHRFVTLQTADRHPSKPHPSMIEAAMADAGATPAATVMIGDTGYDMAMARNAGVRAIGVGWGYHAIAELRRAGADAIVAHPRDITLHMEAA